MQARLAGALRRLHIAGRMRGVRICGVGSPTGPAKRGPMTAHRRWCRPSLQGLLGTNNLAPFRGMGSGMAVWFLWDGRERQGPMNRARSRSEFARIPIVTAAGLARGTGGMASVAEALGPESGVAAQTFPFRRRCRRKRQQPLTFLATDGSNFVTKHWRGQYTLGVSYWVIGFPATSSPCLRSSCSASSC